MLVFLFSSEVASLVKNVSGRYDVFMSKTATRKTVALLAYPGLEILDIAGPASTFAEASRQQNRLEYDLRYIGLTPHDPLESSCGLPLMTKSARTLPGYIDTLLVPGAESEPLNMALKDSRLIKLIGRLARKATRVTSVCTGAFLLGEAGLLDGRRVNTHWAGVSELKQRYPKAHVNTEGLFTKDGDLWTSAGVLSGVDMALAIVQEDLGFDVALNVARRLVVYLVRHGNQSQFSQPLDLQQRAGDERLKRLVSWLRDRTEETTTVEHMASYLSVSERSLHRLCQIRYGYSPGKLFREIRLEQARNLLQQSSQPLKAVAARCGFSSAESLTKAFQQRFGVTAGEYRRRFHPR